MVHDPAGAGHPIARTLAAGLVLVAAAAGCGDGTAPGETGGAGGPRTLGANVQVLECADWNAGSTEERLGTIEQLRGVVGGQVPGTGGRGKVLDDDEAYDLFERACGQDFTRAFSLYKMYATSAAYRGE